MGVYDMSEKKDTFTLFGVELGICEKVNNYLVAVQYWGFEANEVGQSLGLIDSALLEVDFYTGEIDSYNGMPRRKTKLNHTISLCMNVPVTGEIGE